MNYIIKTVDGATIPITENQYKQILQAEAEGKQRFFINGAAIRFNTANFYPEHALEQTEGVLHDGTKVIKKFGQWVDVRNPEIHLDPSYYPEIVQDRVLTPLEWKNRSQGQIGASTTTLEIDQPSEERAKHYERTLGAIQGLRESIGKSF